MLPPVDPEDEDPDEPPLGVLGVDVPPPVDVGDPPDHVLPV